jgi:hypothetical protein
MPEGLAVSDEVFENCSRIRGTEIETTSHITVSHTRYSFVGVSYGEEILGYSDLVQIKIFFSLKRYNSSTLGSSFITRNPDEISHLISSVFFL